MSLKNGYEAHKNSQNKIQSSERKHAVILKYEYFLADYQIKAKQGFLRLQTVQLLANMNQAN